MAIYSCMNPNTGWSTCTTCIWYMNAYFLWISPCLVFFSMYCWNSVTYLHSFFRLDNPIILLGVWSWDIHCWDHIISTNDSTEWGLQLARPMSIYIYVYIYIFLFVLCSERNKALAHSRIQWCCKVHWKHFTTYIGISFPYHLQCVWHSRMQGSSGESWITS